eukprot:5902994-Alexandrium_andersonii.AAC.1
MRHRMVRGFPPGHVLSRNRVGTVRRVASPGVITYSCGSVRVATNGLRIHVHSVIGATLRSSPARRSCKAAPSSAPSQLPRQGSP